MFAQGIVLGTGQTIELSINIENLRNFSCMILERGFKFRNEFMWKNIG